MKRVDIPANLDGAGLRVGVAVSRFAKFNTQPLADGVLLRLEELGVTQVTVVEVHGALELPVVAASLAKSHDAVVAVGVVMAGETDHYLHVSTQSAAGLARVALDSGVPVANAVLTVHNEQAAQERSQPGPSNRGGEAATAAVVAANALRDIATVKYRVDQEMTIV